MNARERWSSIIKLMVTHGYEITGEATDPPSLTLRRFGTQHPVHLDEHFAALMDAFYAQGFTYGFERGAYEEAQQEDVEPVSK